MKVQGILRRGAIEHTWVLPATRASSATLMDAEFGMRIYLIIKYLHITHNVSAVYKVSNGEPPSLKCRAHSSFKRDVVIGLSLCLDPFSSDFMHTSPRLTQALTQNT